MHCLFFLSSVRMLLLSAGDVLATWAVVTGLSEEKEAPRPQPAQHPLDEALELLVAQVHQQPVGEDEVETEKDWNRPSGIIDILLNELIAVKLKIYPTALAFVSINFKPGLYLNTPVFGQIQLCDICLDEGRIAVVTVVLPVFLHKVFHEIHSSYVLGFGQQLGGETTTQTHRNTCCQLHSRPSDWLV